MFLSFFSMAIYPPTKKYPGQFETIEFTQCDCHTFISTRKCFLGRDFDKFIIKTQIQFYTTLFVSRHYGT